MACSGIPCILALEGRLETGIQRQPIKGVLVAAAIGLLMGMLLRKRCRATHGAADTPAQSLDARS